MMAAKNGKVRLQWLAATLLLPCLLTTEVPAQAPALHDGAHDFDFLIGDWKAHVRRLPERLVGSNVWIEYDGISRHKKLLDSNANFEEFDVANAAKGLRIKAQTLRLYNPDSHQWSIYLVDLDKGTEGVAPGRRPVHGASGRILRPGGLERPGGPGPLCLD